MIESNNIIPLDHACLIDAQQDAVQASAPLIEFQRMLDRVSRSITHYDVVGLEKSATADSVRQAYEEIINLLKSPNHRLTSTIPEAMVARIHRAIGRVTHAYSVLSNPAKRADYDALIVEEVKEHEMAESPVPSEAAPPAPELDFASENDHESSCLAQGATGTALIPVATADLESIDDSCVCDNRRKHERFKLELPVYVTGHDGLTGEWHEMTRTVDVSRLGVNIKLSRRVKHRTLLHLALPLPMRLRCHRHCEPSYSVYALVRRVGPLKDGERLTALEFVGEHPPQGYISKPWSTYVTKWSGLDRRRAPRVEASDDISVEYFSDTMLRVRHEAAVIENVSTNGMRICVKSPPPDFELVRIQYPLRGFESFAVVCNRFQGKDRLERLCLQFTDNKLT